MSTTQVRRRMRASREAIYRVLLDGKLLPRWKVPEGMRCEVHAFEPREGGALRVTLTYEGSDGAGKTSSHADTYRGRFIRLVPNEQVVEVDEFETSDPALQGPMTITISLVAVGSETEVIGVHEGLPPGVSPADNETGWAMALARLAELVEA